MSDPQTTQTVLGAMGSAAVAVVAGFMATRQAKATSKAAPYDSLAKRVADLEDEARAWREERALKERHLFAWDLWWDDLSYHWTSHRAEDRPPNKPLPPTPKE